MHYISPLLYVLWLLFAFNAKTFVLKARINEETKVNYIILIIFLFSCMINLHATEPPAEVVHEAQVADSLVADSLIVDSLNTPPPATEVRAVWLTTNYGLDWPRNRTSVEAQKRELREMLDGLQALRFNTVFFQVRARGEVFYLSRLEPMSTLIATARKGEPFFDPLRFAVEECHKRGMELHAWMVTYPLGNDEQVKSLGEQSVTRKNPSLVKRLNKEWFLDPGNPRTDDYLIALLLEVVSISITSDTRIRGGGSRMTRCTGCTGRGKRGKIGGGITSADS
jgi:uncharacterized lipoprotein YddW (UPF0748 family)